MSNIISTNNGDLSEMNSVTNYTNAGKCSCCGACCSVALGLSVTEVKRIKRFVEKNNIQPHDYESGKTNVVDLTCPLLIPAQNETTLCSIYGERPEICKAFKCDENQFKIASKLAPTIKHHDPIKPRNIAQLIFPDKYMPKPGDIVIPNHLFADEEAVKNKYLFVIEEEITPKSEKDPFVHIMRMHMYKQPNLKLECDIAAFVKIQNVDQNEKEG